MDEEMVQCWLEKLLLVSDLLKDRPVRWVFTAITTITNYRAIN